MKTVKIDVEILETSEYPPQEELGYICYYDCIMHAKALVRSGPLAGQRIKIRYFIVRNGKWVRPAVKVAARQCLRLTAREWYAVTDRCPGLEDLWIWDTTDLDLDAPIYWVTSGLDRHLRPVTATEQPAGTDGKNAAQP